MNINSVKKDAAYDVTIGPLCDKCVNKVQFQVVSPIHMKIYEVEYPNGRCYIVRAPDEKSAIEFADQLALTNAGCATEFHSPDGPPGVLEEGFI